MRRLHSITPLATAPDRQRVSSKVTRLTMDTRRTENHVHTRKSINTGAKQQPVDLITISSNAERKTLVITVVSLTY